MHDVVYFLGKPPRPLPSASRSHIKKFSAFLRGGKILSRRPLVAKPLCNYCEIQEGAKANKLHIAGLLQELPKFAYVWLTGGASHILARPPHIDSKVMWARGRRHVPIALPSLYTLPLARGLVCGFEVSTLRPARQDANL